MDAFSEIPMDPDVSMYGFYVLELADYFSAEGMPEEEAKALLNLSFMTLSALRKKELSPWLISATVSYTHLDVYKRQGYL